MVIVWMYNTNKTSFSPIHVCCTSISLLLLISCASASTKSQFWSRRGRILIPTKKVVLSVLGTPSYPPYRKSCSNVSAAKLCNTSATATATAATRSLTERQRQVLNFFSGGVAGTIASMLTNPLEVVKTQLQSSIASKAARGELAAEAGHPLAVARTIMERDGVRGFFRGLRPTLIGIIPARSAYFFAYQQSKRTIAKWATTTGNEKIIVPQTVTSLFAEGSVMNSILSGLFAGIASNTITSPIWMVKTRMQILADSSAGQRVYKSYKEVISTIAKEEGIQGFYKGIFASYWGCAEGCIQFVLYEQFKTYLHKRRQEQQTIMGNQNPKNALHRDLPPHVYFIAAAVAKGIASIATYPHEVARTRLREQARDGLFLYSGMWQTLSIIAKQEGWRGLYAGMGIHLLKVVPNSAIMFLTYEICNSYLDRQFTIRSVDTTTAISA